VTPVTLAREANTEREKRRLTVVGSDASVAWARSGSPNVRDTPA
jgi:hypothetical protein